MKTITEIDIISAKLKGFLAIPEIGYGPGIIVLHSWWGLNNFFKDFCRKLANEGFVTFAPDLYNGAVALTIEEAQMLRSKVDFQKTAGLLSEVVEEFQNHPAVKKNKLGLIGFSMGASWALQLAATNKPRGFNAVVIFYGNEQEIEDYHQSQAAFLGHFAEMDEYESLEVVKQTGEKMQQAGIKFKFYIYPNSKHWFFEGNVSDAFEYEASNLAWERTKLFLNKNLK